MIRCAPCVVRLNREPFVSHLRAATSINAHSLFNRPLFASVSDDHCTTPTRLRPANGRRTACSLDAACSRGLSRQGTLHTASDDVVKMPSSRSERAVPSHYRRPVAPSSLKQPCLSELLLCPTPSFLIPVLKIAVPLDSAKDIAPHPGPLEISGNRLDDQRIFG